MNKKFFIKVMGFVLLTASASVGLYMSRTNTTSPSSYVRKNMYQPLVVKEDDVSATTDNLAEVIAQEKAKRETAAEKKTAAVAPKETAKKK